MHAHDGLGQPVQVVAGFVVVAAPSERIMVGYRRCGGACQRTGGSVVRARAGPDAMGLSSRSAKKRTSCPCASRAPPASMADRTPEGRRCRSERRTPSERRAGSAATVRLRRGQGRRRPSTPRAGPRRRQAGASRASRRLKAPQRRLRDLPLWRSGRHRRTTARGKDAITVGTASTLHWCLSSVQHEDGPPCTRFSVTRPAPHRGGPPSSQSKAIVARQRRGLSRLPRCESARGAAVCAGARPWR